jgi:hypothetical protein
MIRPALCCVPDQGLPRVQPQVAHARGSPRYIAGGYILNSAGWTYSHGSPARYLPAISSTFTANWKA